MGEISPMMGSRCKSTRCGTEGHGHDNCDIFGSVPTTRTQEKRWWKRMWRKEYE